VGHWSCYTTDGGPTEVRNSNGTLSYEFTNAQGTSTLIINAATLAPSRRFFTPYGTQRGTAVTWLDNRTFLNQPTDTVTGLGLLGARNYDPATGSFLQRDPVVENSDVNGIGGYTYAGDNPVMSADPTGLRNEYQYYSAAGVAQRDSQSDDKANAIARQITSHRGCARNPDECGYQPAHHAKPQAKPKKKNPFAQVGAGLVKGWLEVNVGAVNSARASGGYLLGLGLGAASGQISWGDAAASAWMFSQQAGISMITDPFIDLYHQNGQVILDIKNGDWEAAADHTFHAAVDVGNILMMADGATELAGPKCSFTAATPVLMANGATKPIADIQPGDKVASTDPRADGATEPEMVLGTHAHPDTHLTDLTITTTNHHKTTTAVIHTTSNHPFWDDTLHQWINAANLTPSHHLHTTTNQPTVTVTAVHSFTTTHTMHNLTITTTHTYYIIAGTTPILVHNCGPGGTATVHLYDPPAGHASISVTDGATTIHTERAGSLVEGEPVVVQQYSGGPAPSKSFTIRLPNARAAIQAQLDAMAESPTPLDANLNNCVTHCMDILSKGGRPDAPVTAQEGVSWLYETMFDK
jgi:RHS repeat-associated protein